MRKLFILTILLFGAVAVNAQTSECPTDKVCISPEAARKALADADTVIALRAEIKALEDAVNALKDNTQKALLDVARLSGENTALKQNDVSNRAIIEILVKMVRQKKIGLNIF
jgi:hypothetical protein